MGFLPAAALDLRLLLPLNLNLVLQPAYFFTLVKQFFRLLIDLKSSIVDLLLKLLICSFELYGLVLQLKCFGFVFEFQLILLLLTLLQFFFYFVNLLAELLHMFVFDIFPNLSFLENFGFLT